MFLSFYSDVRERGGMLQVRVVQGRRVAVMRFATVAFAQSDLTIWYVAIVLPILILATIVTIWGNQITGKAGEHWASEELRKLPQSEYRLLNDLVLKDSTGLHQIDHVVVLVYGIYVVETKNYTGTICGDFKYSEWFMYLGKNKRKNPFAFAAELRAHSMFEGIIGIGRFGFHFDCMLCESYQVQSEDSLRSRVRGAYE